VFEHLCRTHQAYLLSDFRHLRTKWKYFYLSLCVEWFQTATKLLENRYLLGWLGVTVSCGATGISFGLVALWERLWWFQDTWVLPHSVLTGLTNSISIWATGTGTRGQSCRRLTSGHTGAVWLPVWPHLAHDRTLGKGPLGCGVCVEGKDPPATEWCSAGYMCEEVSVPASGRK
jgi:hypothetical protein